MKSKIFNKSFAILAISLAFVACNSKKEEKKVETPVEAVKVQEFVTPQKQTLNFVGDYDFTVKLTTENNWQTAILTDNSDRTFELKIEPAADGVYLSNEDGVSIHMKNGEASLILGTGRTPIDLKEITNK